MGMILCEVYEIDRDAHAGFWLQMDGLEQVVGALLR
jgi:hypothetical protein